MLAQIERLFTLIGILLLISTLLIMTTMATYAQVEQSRSTLTIATPTP
jgi:hypothetical protein